MPIDGLDHYNLRAQRELLDVLRDFYITVVGLELGARPAFTRFGYWLYAGGRAILHLTEAPPGEHRPAQSTGTFDHTAFSCTNEQVYRHRLESRGIDYRRDEVPLTGQRQLFFRDPAGNGIELNFKDDLNGK